MTPQEREVMQMALDAVETYGPEYMHGTPKRAYIKAIRAALANDQKPAAQKLETVSFRWEPKVIQTYSKKGDLMSITVQYEPGGALETIWPKPN